MGNPLAKNAWSPAEVSAMREAYEIAIAARSERGAVEPREREALARRIIQLAREEQLDVVTLARRCDLAPD